MNSDRREACAYGGAQDPAALLSAEIARLRAELAEARAITAALAHHADVDPLFDILNRRGFERERARRRRRRHVLRAVAGDLTAYLRASDVVARLGGDEFGVLMRNAGELQAAMRARPRKPHRAFEPRAERRAALRWRGRAQPGAEAGAGHRRRRRGDV